jgi:hypothetical protein
VAAAVIIVHSQPKENSVFGFGKSKEKLEKKYQKLLEESYKLSHVDRKKSDLKAAEAEELRKEIDAME